MAKGTTFIGWVAGGAGVILLYSAVRNQSPLEIIRGSLTGEKKDTPIDVGSSSPSLSAGGDGDSTWWDKTTGTGNDRPSRIKRKEIEPTLIPIPTQPNMLMDYEAVASFMRVQIAYGKPIILDNTYRTFAQQQAGYEKNPGVFGKPGTSLHERGLALDIKTTNPNLNDSKLVDAFTKEGWVRRGKVINGKPEPWHWTYKVPG